jgi:hypothetical protein
MLTDFGTRHAQGDECLNARLMRNAYADLIPEQLAVSSLPAVVICRPVSIKFPDRQHSKLVLRKRTSYGELPATIPVRSQAVAPSGLWSITTSVCSDSSSVLESRNLAKKRRVSPNHDGARLNGGIEL